MDCLGLGLQNRRAMIFRGCWPAQLMTRQSTVVKIEADHVPDDSETIYKTRTDPTTPKGWSPQSPTSLISAKTFAKVLPVMEFFFPGQKKEKELHRVRSEIATDAFKDRCKKFIFHFVKIILGKKIIIHFTILEVFLIVRRKFMFRVAGSRKVLS